MKKIFSALLALSLIFALAVPAFAAGIIATGGDYMIYVYIAIGVAAVTLIGGIVLFFTGKKK